MYSVLNKLSEYTYISKNIVSYTFLLVSKIFESLQCIPKCINIPKAAWKMLIARHVLNANICWKMKIFIDNFIKFHKFYFTLRHGCFPVNLLDIFRTPFPKNTCGRLLLFIVIFIPLVELMSKIISISNIYRIIQRYINPIFKL